MRRRRRAVCCRDLVRNSPVYTVLYCRCRLAFTVLGGRPIFLVEDIRRRSSLLVALSFGLPVSGRSTFLLCFAWCKHSTHVPDPLLHLERRRPSFHLDHHSILRFQRTFQRTDRNDVDVPPHRLSVPTPIRYGVPVSLVAVVTLNVARVSGHVVTNVALPAAVR